MRLPGVPESVGEIRAAICRLARSSGFPEEKVDAIRLAVSEAATNALIHGYTEDTGQICVSAELDRDGNLRVVITDHGRGMLPRRDSDGLGLGLPLMAAMSDHIDITSSVDRPGTEVRLYFHTP